MSVILLFLLAIFTIVGWWLLQQGLMSKPWLESGPDSIPLGADKMEMPKAKIGLGLFLGVVGCMFALFTSGFFMRMEYPDWRSMPLPPVVWVNTGLLIMGSLSMHFAVSAAKNHDLSTVKICLVSGGIAAFGFLTGQLMAWRQLADAGYVMVANPANSFFYMITAMHGLHILGGLVAWGRTTRAAFDGIPFDRLSTRIELCAIYWHFLLFIWFALLVVLVGWANDLFDICRQLLS